MEECGSKRGRNGEKGDRKNRGGLGERSRGVGKGLCLAGISSTINNNILVPIKQACSGHPCTRHSSLAANTP